MISDGATIRLARPDGDAGVVERVASAPLLQSGLWDVGLPIFPAEILENLAVGEPARRCWMVLWRWAGCKPGYVKCDAGSLMSALGARDKRTVRGYRDELHKLGAVSLIDDGPRWLLHVNDPIEANGERPRLKSSGRYRYLAFMAGETANDGGSFCARTPAGDSAGVFARGGRGGKFLDQETKQENPPPPPDSEGGSFCAKTPADDHAASRSADGAGEVSTARPATAAGQGVTVAMARRADVAASWPQAERRLRQAGLRVFRAAASQAGARGMAPHEVISFVDFFEARRLHFDGPGALLFALSNWSPGMEASEPTLWPTPKQSLQRVEESAERKRQAELQQQADEQRAAAERVRNAELERRYGPTADVLSDADVELLLPLMDEFGRRYVRAHWQRPWSFVVRDRLICALARRDEGAK